MWGSDGPIFTGDLNGDGKTDDSCGGIQRIHGLSIFLPGMVLYKRDGLGAWGSDGPILTGDLNGDGKTDVFMWACCF